MATPDKLALYRALREKERRLAGRRIDIFYPSTGPLRRELYPKQLQFFRLGLHNRERMMISANRIGKTEGVGGYETVCHLTGDYPVWWEGYRFTRPVRAWAAGDTSKTVREIIQMKLLGPWTDRGTGMIPRDSIIKVVPRAGASETAETIYVKHRYGVSVLLLKSYDQRREAFQGTEQDLIWLDEEPPQDIYTECLLRTMTTNGLIMLTYTPVMGMTLLTADFMDPAKGKAVVTATWDDVPHLTPAAKQELWDSIPVHQQQARAKGIPYLGSGVIYPVPEEVVTIAPFDIPRYWPREYALDVGWKRTAAVWGALDRESDTWYLYSEHYRSHAEPPVHADAILARGAWIAGVIDPASMGGSQRDGKSLFQLYSALLPNLTLADNSVEAGIFDVWTRLSGGRLRVFSNLSNWLREYRMYRRDENGEIVEGEDHLMDCTRYLIRTPIPSLETDPDTHPTHGSVGRSRTTGY